jgi:hypothetical protein
VTLNLKVLKSLGGSTLTTAAFTPVGAAMIAVLIWTEAHGA